jgi:anaerobic sulfite reductase subunit B
VSNPYSSFKASILSVKPQTDIDYTFRLATDLKVSSGQFVEVSIPRVGEAPISVSDFGEGWIEMTIRRAGKLTDVIHEMIQGKHLYIRGPYGNGFPMDKFKGKNLIIAAGGTGLAPVKSIISSFNQGITGIKDLTLLAGFKTPADVLFRDEISKWHENIQIEITVDNDDTGNWPGGTGLITGLIEQMDIANLEQTEVIIVGPPVMIKFSYLEFIKKGIRKENVWVSFERKMCCGIGKCGHCKIDGTYVCLEGPVFNYAKAEQLVD